MKIILSGSGQGKTAKVAELAAKYADEGGNVYITSGELTTSQFGKYLHREKADLGYIKFKKVDSFEEIVETIKADNESDVFLVDGLSVVISHDSLNANHSIHESIKQGLRALHTIEQNSEKKLYVTMQSRAETLTVFDYDPETIK